MSRRRGPRGAAGDRAIVDALAANYRFWASLPSRVTAVLALAQPSTTPTRETILAAVARPVFPRGVCTGCGCTETDPCLREGLMGEPEPEPCWWANAQQTRCSFCPPSRTRKATLG